MKHEVPQFQFLSSEFVMLCHLLNSCQYFTAEFCHTPTGTKDGCISLLQNVTIHKKYILPSQFTLCQQCYENPYVPSPTYQLDGQKYILETLNPIPKKKKGSR
jgi:hypothetical protein